MRNYYGDMPKYLQAGEHQFVEDKLIELWISSTLLGWYVNHNVMFGNVYQRHEN